MGSLSNLQAENSDLQDRFSNVSTEIARLTRERMQSPWAPFCEA
jgi:hypothetical protein